MANPIAFTRALRAALNLTQAELAAYIGVTARTIKRW